MIDFALQKLLRNLRNVLGVSQKSDTPFFNNQTSYTAAQRVTGTVYQNTSGRPMFLSVCISKTTGGTHVIYSDANPAPTQLLSQQTINGGTVTNSAAMIIPGNYYKFTYDGGGVETRYFWQETV